MHSHSLERSHAPAIYVFGWGIIGVFGGLVPFVGPAVIGTRYIEKHAKMEIPFFTYGILSMGIVVGTFVSAHLVYGVQIAIDQIAVLACTCGFAWIRICWHGLRRRT